MTSRGVNEPACVAPDHAARVDRAARAVERAGASIVRPALRRLDNLAWFRALPAEERAEVGLMVHRAVAEFGPWVRGQSAAPDSPVRVLQEASPGLTRSISLKQTVELIREVVLVADATVASLVSPADEDWVSAQIMRYTRDLAFGVAAVYAKAAERHGNLGARLEAHLVDAVARGEADEHLLSRAAALGWTAENPVCVLVGERPAGDPDLVLLEVARTARRAGHNVLAGVHGERLVVVMELPGHAAGEQELRASVRVLLPAFARAPVVVGPRVASLAEASASAASAFAGHRAAALAVDLPDLVLADDLLAERALDGDATAVDELHRRIYLPLVEAGHHMARTIWTYLEVGESLQQSANLLYVHQNTLRYRLKRAAELTGYDPAAPKDRLAIRIALAKGRAAGRDSW